MMKKIFLAAGAAAMALAVPALAEKGGHGGGHGNQGGGHDGGQAHGNKGGGHGGDRDRGHQGKGGDHFARHSDRGPSMKQARAEQKAERGPRFQRSDDRRDDRVRVREVERVEGRYADARFVNDRSRDMRGLVDGCPPGLAMKHNGCLPPGQAKERLGTRIDQRILAASIPAAYSNWYRDDDDYYYRYDQGYLYRIDRSNQLVSGLLPMFGDEYYPVGAAYPSPYNFYNVPMQYRDYYPAQSDYLYRYGNGAIYALDPKTNLVNSIVALVAGDLAVGQPMPSAYSVYNVPLDYRDQYADTANDWYRYNDGYIYRVDPTTQLVSAMVQAIL